MELTAEQLLFISAFRKETEDLFKALTRQYYFNGGIDPYENTAQVLSVIGNNWLPFMTVNVAGVEYWYLADGSLVNKNAYLANADNSIALNKLLNITGASFIGKQTGNGSPEVLTVETALQMLGLTNVLTTLGQKVDRANGYSLVANELIALIHTPGSDDQDLTGIIASIETLTSLVNSMSPPFKIILPSADTVAGRLVGLTDGVNFPTGWVLSADDKDLIVTHGLAREVKDVVVWSKNTLEGIKRKELGNAAYSGIYQAIGTAYNSFVIEALATINSEITIYISFT